MKKILLLCFSVWLSLASWATDFEADGIYYNIVSEDDATCEVTYLQYETATPTYTGALTIPETVGYGNETYTVIGIGEYAFYGCTLTSVSIPETVGYIGTYAFSTSDIESVVISDYVTDLGENAFRSCPSLTDVVIGDGVTEIKPRTFYGTPIKNITIGNSVTSIGTSAFFQCEALESIKFPDSLLSIDTQAFNNCKSLKEVAFGNSLESLGMMAFASDAIEELELPNSLVSFPNGFEFYENANLKKVTLGNAVESLGSFTFFNCTGLEEFYSPVETPPSGATYAFTGASTSTCVLYVPEGCVDAYKVASGWKDFYSIEVIASSDNPFADGTKFEWDGFYYNVVSAEERTVEVTWGGESSTSGTDSYVGNITIPGTVTYDNVAYTVIGIGEYAFYACKLTSVSIPETVGYIGTYAFSTSDIASIAISDYVTDLGENAFRSCPNLTDVVIGDGVPEIKPRTFYGTPIKNITIGNSVTSIGTGAFFQCEALESIKFPDSLLSIDTQAFNNCTSLKEVTFGSSLESLGMMAFASDAIEELELPNSLVSFPNGFEFYENANLKKVTLGNAVESLGSFTFFNCTGLEEFYSPVETPPSGADYSFTGASTSTCVLYVPEGCVDAYRAASGWKDFYDIEEILPEGINSIDSDVDMPNVEGYYSTSGQKLNNTVKGVNIIRYSDGTSKKVLMK